MKILKYNLHELIFLTFKESTDKLLINKIREDSIARGCAPMIFYYIDFNKKNIIKQKIKYLKKEGHIKIRASKVDLKVILPTQKNLFLNTYHFQGSDLSAICYGAFYKDELLGVMCFNDNRTMNGGNPNPTEYELSRFAIKAGYIIHGIFNKFLLHFINEYKPSKIISFADRRFSQDNNIYELNGFKLDKKLPQDYFYINNINPTKLFHKFNFGKQNIAKKFPLLFNKHETETQLMIKAGFSRFWDCGKNRYVLTLDENGNAVYGLIYKITNTINNKIYIGQTTRSLNKRKSEYKKALLKESFYNDHLYNSFMKYGFENFNFEIIDFALNIDELNAKEIKWISHYNSNDKSNGYNQSSGGKNAIPSEETKLKMSLAGRGKKQTNTWIKKRISLAGSEEAKKYGKIKTEEEKIKLSDNSPKFWLGKSRSDDTKIKISETKKKQALLPANTKKVAKVDAITGSILATYTSTTDAARQNPSLSQSSISRKCNGITKNIGDVLWKFI
jgi:group I intron endonuclease